MTTAYINKISTLVPEHDLHHDFIDYAEQTIDDENRRILFRRMAERSQISHRYSPISSITDFYGADPNQVSVKDRMVAYEQYAPALAVKAVDNLGLGAFAQEITHLVIVTCTGFYSPGIDFEIIRKCGLDPSVERTQIGFMGCFAGITGLKFAHHLVRSQPDAKVLLVSAELCTLHLQKTDSLETLLSFLIFSDGCAAALITAEEKGVAIDSFKAVMVPDSVELMTWRIGDVGFDMVLSGKVPGALHRALDEENLKLILDGREKSDIDVWAVHPGGRSILDAMETVLDLGPTELEISRQVLDTYGNMSSATILFVLAEIMRRADGNQRSQGCALAFGPGLTAETMLFRA